MNRYETEKSKEQRGLTEPVTQSIAIQRSPQPGAGTFSPGTAVTETAPYAGLQSNYGNAAVAQSFTQPENENKPAAATAAGLIVEDTAETLEPGQMRKSEFLAQLRASVCSATAEALADTPWSEAGCPYIDRWFGHYSAQSGDYIERAIRRYAPEAAGATAASGYIPAITARVRQSVTTWATTGEITGVPEGMPLGLPGEGLMGTAGGVISGVAGAVSTVASGVGSAPSAKGSIFFKERDGGAKEVGDPQAIQAQLGAGKSLDGGVKSRMESAFGESFSGVQVHTDGNAARLSDDLNARAFTIGNQIAFGAGEYQPGTLIGDALIAHELAHVTQQRGGDSPVSPAREGATGYGVLENDADRAAVGAVVSIWGGAKVRLGNIAQYAMPRLRSGLRLQRCESKEIKRLGGLQYSFLEEKRRKMEEDERMAAEEAAKRRGEVNPKIEIKKKSVDDVLTGDVKKSGFAKHPTDPWEKDISEPDRQDYINKRAPAAWKKVIESVKGTELEDVMKGKTYRFEPKETLENGYYAYRDGNALVFGMAWVQNAEADPKNVWPNLAHEMGGHFEYGQPYTSRIMNAAVEMMPEAERKKLREDPKRRTEFYLTYIYPETEIYSALRELRYAEPEKGPKPTYYGKHPHINIPDRLNKMKDVLHPDVAKAVLKELKRRIDASPDILPRDKKYFEDQVKVIFGYLP